jgi:hypothetical protein
METPTEIQKGSQTEIRKATEMETPTEI